MVIHCGACMVNRKSVINKINLCKEKIRIFKENKNFRFDLK